MIFIFILNTYLANENILNKLETYSFFLTQTDFDEVGMAFMLYIDFLSYSPSIRDIE